MLWEEQGHWTTPHQHSVFLYVYVCVWFCVVGLLVRFFGSLFWVAFFALLLCYAKGRTL